MSASGRLRVATALVLGKVAVIVRPRRQRCRRDEGRAVLAWRSRAERHLRERRATRVGDLDGGVSDGPLERARAGDDRTAEQSGSAGQALGRIVAAEILDALLDVLQRL